MTSIRNDPKLMAMLERIAEPWPDTAFCFEEHKYVFLRNEYGQITQILRNGTPWAAGMETFQCANVVSAILNQVDAVATLIEHMFEEDLSNPNLTSAEFIEILQKFQAQVAPLINSVVKAPQ